MYNVENKMEKSRKVTDTVHVIRHPKPLCEYEVWKVICPSRKIVLRVWPGWDNCEGKQ